MLAATRAGNAASQWRPPPQEGRGRQHDSGHALELVGRCFLGEVGHVHRAGRGGLRAEENLRIRRVGEIKKLSEGPSLGDEVEAGAERLDGEEPPRQGGNRQPVADAVRRAGTLEVGQRLWPAATVLRRVKRGVEEATGEAERADSLAAELDRVGVRGQAGPGVCRRSPYSDQGDVQLDNGAATRPGAVLRDAVGAGADTRHGSEAQGGEVLLGSALLVLRDQQVGVPVGARAAVGVEPTRDHRALQEDRADTRRLQGSDHLCVIPSMANVRTAVSTALWAGASRPRRTLARDLYERLSAVRSLASAPISPRRQRARASPARPVKDGAFRFSAARSSHYRRRRWNWSRSTPASRKIPASVPRLSSRWSRNHKRDRPLRMLEANVAAALADRDPAEFAERQDELGAGDDRQPFAHTGSGSLRRTMPASRNRPSSRSPST